MNATRDRSGSAAVETWGRLGALLADALAGKPAVEIVERDGGYVTSVTLAIS